MTIYRYKKYWTDYVIFIFRRIFFYRDVLSIIGLGISVLGGIIFFYQITEFLYRVNDDQYKWLLNDDEGWGDHKDSPIVSISILDNDRFPPDSNDSTILLMTLESDALVSEDQDLIVMPYIGTWSLNAQRTVTFVSEPQFRGDPNPIQYSIKGIKANHATITIHYQ